MTNVYTVDSVTEFIQTAQNNGLVLDIKVGKVDALYFNDMEGYNYNASINIITPDGYRNRRLVMRLNDTYLQEWEIEKEATDNTLKITNKDIIQYYFDNMFI